MILDYDIVILRYGINHPLVHSLGYSTIAKAVGSDRGEIPLKFKEEWKNIIDKSSINTKTGIFGYSGRIPTSNIISIETNLKAIAITDYLNNSLNNINEVLGLDKTYFTTNTYSINDVKNSMPKMIKEYKLDGVEYISTYFNDDGYEEEIYQYVTRKELVDATVDSDIFYHGTTTVFLNTISKQGIKGHSSISNFEVIHDSDKVFVTTKLSKAYFHAQTAVSEHGGVPLIIRLKIPVPYRLILDYDIAIDRYGIDQSLVQSLGHGEVYHNYSSYNRPPIEPRFKEEWENIIDKSSINTKTGIFGYKGRIPTSNFTRISTFPEAIVNNELYGDTEGYDYSIDEIDHYRNFKDLYKDIEHYQSQYDSDDDD